MSTWMSGSGFGMLCAEAAGGDSRDQQNQQGTASQLLQILDPSPRLKQAILKLFQKMRFNFRGSLNLCWRRVLHVIPCKLSSHPSLKDVKAIPTSPKGISRRPQLLSAQGEEAGQP